MFSRVFRGLVMGPVSLSIFINDEVGGENTNSTFIKGKRVLNWEALQTPQRTKKQHAMGMVDNLDKGEKDRVPLGDKGPGSPRGETT